MEASRALPRSSQRRANRPRTSSWGCVCGGGASRRASAWQRSAAAMDTAARWRPHACTAQGGLRLLLQAQAPCSSQRPQRRGHFPTSLHLPRNRLRQDSFRAPRAASPPADRKLSFLAVNSKPLDKEDLSSRPQRQHLPGTGAESLERRQQWGEPGRGPCAVLLGRQGAEQEGEPALRPQRALLSPLLDSGRGSRGQWCREQTREGQEPLPQGVPCQATAAPCPLQSIRKTA